jgi:hypothetical protein
MPPSYVTFETWWCLSTYIFSIASLLLLLLLHFLNMPLCIGFLVLDEISYCQTELMCYCHVCYIFFVEENRVFF